MGNPEPWFTAVIYCLPEGLEGDNGGWIPPPPSAGGQWGLSPPSSRSVCRGTMVTESPLARLQGDNEGRAPSIQERLQGDNGGWVPPSAGGQWGLSPPVCRGQLGLISPPSGASAGGQWGLSSPIGASAGGPWKLSSPLQGRLEGAMGLSPPSRSVCRGKMGAEPPRLQGTMGTEPFLQENHLLHVRILHVIINRPWKRC